MMQIKKKKDKKNQKELIDLDNEILIGITPKPKKDSNKTKSKDKKKRKVINNKKTKTGSRRKTDKIDINENKNNIRNTQMNYDIEIEKEFGKNKKKANIKPQKKKTKKQIEKERKRRRRIFKIIKWTSIFVILIGGTVCFLLSPIFNIKEINITGNERISTEEILSLSETTLQDNTFRYSKYKIQEKIKSNAYIESVIVKRKLPDKMEIQVQERIPTYMFNLANAYVYINNQGYILEISSEPLELPTLIGIATEEENIKVGERLLGEDLEKLNDIIKIMNSYTNIGIDSIVDKIDITNKQDYKLQLTAEKKLIHMGDSSNLGTKMLYIESILEKNKNIEGEIFVNTDLDNKGARFKEKV